MELDFSRNHWVPVKLKSVHIKFSTQDFQSTVQTWGKRDLGWVELESSSKTALKSKALLLLWTQAEIETKQRGLGKCRLDCPASWNARLKECLVHHHWDHWAISELEVGSHLPLMWNFKCTFGICEKGDQRVCTTSKGIVVLKGWLPLQFSKQRTLSPTSINVVEVCQPGQSNGMNDVITSLLQV